MAIDLMGPRFYTQQMSASRGGSKKVAAKTKKDIVKDIELIMGITIPSLLKVLKPDLETIYDEVNVYKR